MVRLQGFVAGWILVGLCVSTPIQAQTRRALLIGIDRYSRPSEGARAPLSERTRARLTQVRGNASRLSISSLDGATRDARELADLLMRKFAFREENIRLLVNEQATGDAILSNLENFLVAQAAKGDVSFFFFAGHGSRIRNSATRNASGMDSTILPADSLLGVPDIRSKELARLYLRAAERGVHLTVIQDSCFSGGGARGVLPGRRVRSQEPEADVSVNETLDASPEEKGVLVLSASQDYQPAQEVQTPTGSHGAFTWALLTAMETSGPDERANRIFQRTRALMQSRVNDQEPVMSQWGGRSELGLFAQAADPTSRGGAAAVGFIDRDKGVFELNSGITLGLYPGCELKRIAPASPPARLRVTEVNGPSSSNTVLMLGDRDSVKVGDLFRLDKWVAPADRVLHLYVGPGVSEDELARAVKLAAAVRQDGVDVVEDPSVAAADFVLFYDGSWKLLATASNVALMSSPSVPGAQAVLDKVRSKARPRLSIVLPPPVSLAASLRTEFANRNGLVAEEESVGEADYMLAGAVQDGSARYAWLRPGETEADLARGSVTAPVWPLRSDWVSVGDAQVHSKLKEQMRGLTRIAGWLRLRTPVPDDAFPYRLALRDAATKSPADRTLFGGRSYKLFLELESGAGSSPTGETRWVYVFALDSYGKSTLIFPRNGNIGNLMPNERDPEGNVRYPREIPLTRDTGDIEVEPPFGVDNYFLLTTSQPVENPGEVFTAEGVRTRSAAARASSPLAQLIQSVAQGVRGAVSGVPTTWSVDRIAMISRASESSPKGAPSR